jgi:cobalamin biosynthesis protein CobT
MISINHKYLWDIKARSHNVDNDQIQIEPEVEEKSEEESEEESQDEESEDESEDEESEDESNYVVEEESEDDMNEEASLDESDDDPVEHEAVEEESEDEFADDELNRELLENTQSKIVTAKLKDINNAMHNSSKLQNEIYHENKEYVKCVKSVSTSHRVRAITIHNVVKYLEGVTRGKLTNQGALISSFFEHDLNRSILSNDNAILAWNNYIDKKLDGTVNHSKTLDYKHARSVASHIRTYGALIGFVDDVLKCKKIRASMEKKTKLANQWRKYASAENRNNIKMMNMQGSN